MRYATYLKGAALAASAIGAAALMSGPASADVIISGYAAPAYDGPVYYSAPGYAYDEPVGSVEAVGPPVTYGYAVPVAGPYAYRYASNYYYPRRGYIPPDDDSFSYRVDFDR